MMPQRQRSGELSTYHQSSAPPVPADRQPAAADPAPDTAQMFEWEPVKWMGSISDIDSILIEALLDSPADGQDAMRQLRELGSRGSRDEVARRARERISAAGVLERLGDAIGKELVRLAAKEELPEAGAPMDPPSAGKEAAAPASAASPAPPDAEELNLKYSQDPRSFHKLAYGDFKTFFRGLEGVVGPPAPVLTTGINREHCRCADSNEHFTANNYGTRTTSMIEFYFSFDPEEGEMLLAEVADHGWPGETKLPDGALPRRAMPLQAMMQKVHEKNQHLKKVDSPPLRDEEVLGARLYTGPVRSQPRCLRGHAA